MLRIFPKSRQKKNQGHKETSYCVDLAFDPKKKKKKEERERKKIKMKDSLQRFQRFWRWHLKFPS
jgi:hypothetical protein